MKAWQYIEQDGWWQATQAWREGRLCVFMAIRKACHGDSVKIMGAVRQVVQAVGGREGEVLPLYAWNDHPERTQAEVIALLQRLDV